MMDIHFWNDETTPATTKLIDYQKRWIEQMLDPDIDRIVMRYPSRTWSSDDIEYYRFLQRCLNDISSSLSEDNHSLSDRGNHV